MSIKSKIGAVVKLLANKFWDIKLAGKGNTLNIELPAMYNWSTKIQSIDYLYLIESLKYFQLLKNDKVLDLGSGKGRVLLYCDYKYNTIEKKDLILYGAEINEEAYTICKGACRHKKVQIDNINALENDYITQHKFNKILLFNPFNENTFSLFLQYMQYNISYQCTFLYVNISQDQIKILQNTNTDFKLLHIHKPLLGIWNKTNCIVYFNRNQDDK